jgi:glycosyltransferase involved in cell wall biosynthesis
LALIGDELVQGDGSEKERLRQLTVNLGLFDHVLFAGFDPNPYKWMSAAAVFVSSSTAEGFPNVIAEALAVGCPVVATDCPGDTAKLLEDGRWGRLVPVGNPESMATAILEALDDPSPSDGLMRAANFSPSKIVREYLQVLIPQSIYDDNSRVSDR